MGAPVQPPVPAVLFCTMCEAPLPTPTASLPERHLAVCGGECYHSLEELRAEARGYDDADGRELLRSLL